MHGNRGRPSKRRLCESKRTLIVALLEGHWIGFGPTFASEKLLELHNIKISPETLRKLMAQEGLRKPKKRKQKYRSWRPRKEHLGKLIQLDGSCHAWFEQRGPSCTLLVFIDDATSKIMLLEFVSGESFSCVARSIKKYLLQHGRPLTFYVDGASVFRVNKSNPDNDKRTQLKRALNELNIELKYASTPQAKGRVERTNGTLQDRLVKELRLHNISTMEEGNQFLSESDWLEKHNRKFSAPALSKGDVHRSIKGYNLAMILCRREQRLLCNDYTISYRRAILQLTRYQPVVLRPKTYIKVHELLDGRLLLSVRGKILAYKKLGHRKEGKLNAVEYVNRERTDPQNLVYLTQERGSNYVVEKGN